ncbi:Ger(x)C family spore germination protein [Sporosarcina sp. G11-34]|uniref:Ger(x)C family spore germination protein n=1 Tax=Sporosarcina sp. G11-34 TaxID=2849605 RepID=UPI0022A98D98|nr:Ger(x)C family spore germination protein [Sporosarcina sp. G11-34]MCZ2258243.1 Ger(x)C family spore germination protein [Sporosarcina sp. G11-34]
MKKIALISIACSFLLGGCWDEQLYKDLTIVPLIGYEGEPGELKGYYTKLEVTNGTASYSTVEGSGVSPRETRLDANRKTGETLSVTQLQVMLLAGETVKSDVIKTFDVLFRAPTNPLSSKFVVVEGKMAPYMKKPEKVSVELPNYYIDMLEAAISFSIIPDIDIQQTAGLLFDDAIDLALPFVKMSEMTGTPEVWGVALFSGKVFTDHTLDKQESTIVQVLRKKPGKHTLFTYTWEKEDKSYPITVELATYKKKWDIRDSKIDATYKMKFGVEEFPSDHLDEDKTRKELEKFLSKELTKDFNKVIKKLQEAKSDVVGFGRNVRAFHPQLWNKGKWNDTFSELDINVKVEAEITRTGILN